MAEMVSGSFFRNTVDNPKNESCKAISLRSGKVISPPNQKPQKTKMEDVVGIWQEKEKMEEEVEGAEVK